MILLDRLFSQNQMLVFILDARAHLLDVSGDGVHVLSLTVTPWSPHEEEQPSWRHLDAKQNEMLHSFCSLFSNQMAETLLASYS